MSSSSSSSIEVTDDDTNNSSAIRKELEDYLLYMSEKTDSDGMPLIVLPNNFDKITESMNRDDLYSNNEELWCNRLFQNNVDHVLRDEFDGRYSSYLAETPEVKISNGLAQIQLLDRQLQDIARKQVKHSTNDNAKDTDMTFLTRRTEPVDNIPISNSVKQPTALLPQNRTSEIDTQQALRLEELLSLSDEAFYEQDDYLQCMRNLATQNARIDAELEQYGNSHLLVLPEVEAESQQQLEYLAEQVSSTLSHSFFC